MNDFREQLLKREKEEEQRQYDEVINNPNLSPEQLWELTERNFQAWRRKYDYPNLIESFNVKLPSFVEWKNEFKITDGLIIEVGVVDFISYKKLSKDKTLYLLEETTEDRIRRIVAYGDLSTNPLLIPGHKAIYKLLKKFTSFSDWCVQRKIPSGLFNITNRNAPKHYLERVWLDTGYELLKMDGFTARQKGLGSLPRARNLAFVNMCGLELEGEMYWGEKGAMELSYCAVDNWVCKNLKLTFLDLEYCSVTNLKVQDSEIENWRFWECLTNGDIINSKLFNVRVYGGAFNPFYQDTKIIELEATHVGVQSSWNYADTYSNIKKLYADQGNDVKATVYYIKEKELYREYSKGWRYILKTISYYYWGYGKKPIRIVWFSIELILFSSIFYYLFSGSIAPINVHKSILDCIYFSTVTFTTVGYGDLAPLDGLRIVALVEAFLGAISIGFLVAGFSNAKY